VWNGLRPMFSDIDPATLTLSAGSVLRTAGVRTSAIVATHTYGTPCDVEGLADAARREGVRLFFDAAHAFGSKRDGRSIGSFGDAEVFSLSPTKVLVAGEGGIIATNDDLLAERCRMGRDYGNPGDYDCLFVGLNARMSELHAAVALRSFEDLDDRIHQRNELADLYQRLLEDLPGIGFPYVRDEDRSTYKDFTIIVDPVEFGIDAAELGDALALEGIETRRYYAPPVHQMRAYRHSGGRAAGQLPVTESVSPKVLSIPLWSSMTEAQVRGVAEAIERIQHTSERKVIKLPGDARARQP
jgi:dTDP-4-amino-4,6-dideoxygalactose transaminase